MLFFLIPTQRPFLFDARGFAVGYAAMALGLLALGLPASVAHSLARGGPLTASVFAGHFAAPLVGTPFIAARGFDGLFEAVALLAVLSLVTLTVSLRRAP